MMSRSHFKRNKRNKPILQIVDAPQPSQPCWAERIQTICYGGYTHSFQYNATRVCKGAVR